MNDIREKRRQLFIVHGSVDGSFGDLESIDVHDGKDGTGFGRVDVLESVPCAGIIFSVVDDRTRKKSVDLRSCGSSLSLSVTYYACNHEVWFIHDGAKGYTQGVAQFTAFVDGSGSCAVDVTDKAHQIE
jgi:hypothetical protein